MAARAAETLSEVSDALPVIGCTWSHIVCQAFREALVSTKTVDPSALEHVYLKGHRWSAAFPVQSAEYMSSLAAVGGDERSFFDASLRFGACGDYFGLSGTIEGAALSGDSIASKIILHEKSR